MGDLDDGSTHECAALALMNVRARVLVEGRQSQEGQSREVDQDNC